MKSVVAILLLCIAVPVAAKKAVVFDPAADPAALAAVFVKLEKPAVLAGMKRAAFAQFRIEYAVENDAKASSSGSAGWSSARSDIKLVGVTDEARMAIADSLQDAMIEQLRQAGLAVIPHETVAATKGYQSLAKILHNAPEVLGVQTGKSAFVGAHGTPFYTTNDDKHLSLGSMLGGFSTTQPQNIEPGIAKELDAAVLRVTLMVAFAEQKTGGGLFRSGSSVKTGAGLTIVPKLSGILIVTPKGRSRVTVSEPIQLESDALTLTETTTTGEKATQAVANVVTGLLAGGVRTQAHYEASTTPEAYTELVTRYGLALAAAMMSVIGPAIAGTAPAR